MRDIEQYTENYHEPGFEEYQVAYRRRKVLEILKKYRPKRMLEIGCGMEPLFQYVDWEYDLYVVIEPSEMFWLNVKDLSKGNEKIKCFNECFKANEELKGMDFDFILCSSLLHELEKPIDLLNDIVKICGDNTIVHINVPNANSLHRLIAKEMGLISDVHDMSQRNQLLQQNSVYDLGSLKQSVTIAGLKVIEEGSYFVKPFAHSQMYEMLLQNIISEKVLDGLYSLGKYIPEYGSEIYVNCKI